MSISANSDACILPDELKNALRNLAGQKKSGIPSADLIREMFARNLIERTGRIGIRFTELGRRVFRELRESNPEPLQESRSDVLFPPGVQSA